MKSILIAILLAVLIVACQQKEAPPTPLPSMPSTPDAAPQQPQAPPAQAQGSEGDAAQGVVTGADKTFGTVNKTSALKVDDVRCNLAERKIEFRFKNDDTRTWSMDQELGWNAPRDKTNIQVLINNYEANGRNQYINNGETFFGPSWPFSANCGGVKELAPGEDVTCTLQPVPLKTSTGLTQGLNEIFIKTPTSKHIIQFMCS